MNTHLQFEVARWLEQDPDEHTRAEILALQQTGNDLELAARFAHRLAFGTAGIRGVVGAGPGRMNRLVVRQTSAGLGQYLLAQIKDAKTRGVVIGYDGRNDSRQFAHDAAAVLTAMGIRVRLTFKVAPTPLVAFGVKHFNAAAAVVVTASHNPPEYNGYKVYWENGAQIIPPHDAGIAACIDAAASAEIPLMDPSEATKAGLLIWLQEDYFQIYRRAVAAAAELTDVGELADISLSYTAMHGVGAEMAETLLHDAGFARVYSVAAQRQPDGNFPTVAFPNPEEKGAMDLVIAEAIKQDALLACANDPDADRFAVAVRTAPGQYQMLSGDQVGVLLADHLLRHAPDNQKLVGNTIVSSSLLAKVAAAHGGQAFTTLTGFKWLMNVAQQLQTEQQRFLFAYEEALGYTVGSTVWDKDGLSAQLAFVQLVAGLAASGQSLWDRLEAIYRQHGYYLNEQIGIKLKESTPDIGAGLRAAPPSQIGGVGISQIDDIKSSTRWFADGRQEALDLPASDVLIYWLANGSRVIVRPSGTEPKIKCYYEVVTAIDTAETLAQARQRGREMMDNLISSHQASLPQ